LPIQRNEGPGCGNRKNCGHRNQDIFGEILMQDEMKSSLSRRGSLLSADSGVATPAPEGPIKIFVKLYVLMLGVIALIGGGVYFLVSEWRLLPKTPEQRA